jgi:hypothetical protein
MKTLDRITYRIIELDPPEKHVQAASIQARLLCLLLSL